MSRPQDKEPGEDPLAAQAREAADRIAGLLDEPDAEDDSKFDGFKLTNISAVGFITTDIV